MKGISRKPVVSRRRLNSDMISTPQGAVKHTSHVGADGAFFGDLSFLGSHQFQQQLPQNNQILDSHTDSSKNPTVHEPESTTAVLSDDEFDSCFDFGPPLMDEILKAFSTGTHYISELLREETVEITGNDIKESENKDQQILSTEETMVKTISPSDEKLLDSAMAMAAELASLSLQEMSDSTSDPIDTQVSPNKTPSPSKLKSRFSFRFKSKSDHRPEKRSFTEEATSVANIDECLSEEAQMTYNSLVNRRRLGSEDSAFITDNSKVVTRSKHRIPIAIQNIRRAVSHDSNWLPNICKNGSALFASSPKASPKATRNSLSSSTQNLPEVASNDRNVKISRSELSRNNVSPKGPVIVSNEDYGLSGPDMKTESSIVKHVTAERSDSTKENSGLLLAESSKSEIRPLSRRDRTKFLQPPKPRRRNHPLELPPSKIPAPTDGDRGKE